MYKPNNCHAKAWFQISHSLRFKNMSLQNLLHHTDFTLFPPLSFRVFIGRLTEKLRIESKNNPRCTVCFRPGMCVQSPLCNSLSSCLNKKRNILRRVLLQTAKIHDFKRRRKHVSHTHLQTLLGEASALCWLPQPQPTGYL